MDHGFIMALPADWQARAERAQSPQNNITGGSRMSHIHIEREHDLDRKTLRKRAEKLAQHLQQNFGGDYSWEGDTVHYNYSGGIDARLTLEKEEVLVDVKLGMLMRMLKGRIENEIEGYLDRHLS